MNNAYWPQANAFLIQIKHNLNLTHTHTHKQIVFDSKTNERWEETQNEPWTMNNQMQNDIDEY